ncbi:MAG: beta-ketoacyl-[acyl-carrier-protein] synthase family protein [Desulfobacterales bacterium]|nr:MAG: beta-ketoacyl-[acyl-carrier-protein] synthase family protein [Desulfobacterales bacterium]
MSAVWITNAAAVTPLGNDPGELWQRLLAGQTSIKPVTRFRTDNYHADLASCFDDLDPASGGSRGPTLLERLIPQIGPVPSEALLITATTKGGIDNLERTRRDLPAEARDMLLANMAEKICAQLGLTGGSLNINAACASSTLAVAQGAALIATGGVETVLIACMDLVTEFVFSGFSALQALSTTPCRPFDRKRSGLSLGEGAAALLLMSEARARREERSHLGTVLGWGAANDAHHITAPDPNGHGLQQAIEQALKRARLYPEDIIAISAHGTGTIYNDRMELKAFKTVFGDRRIPIYSVKGAIGHTLGAAGGIEVALGLKSLATQTVPPTVGFTNPEAGAEGCVSPTSLKIAGECLLTTNSGFGGINAALILGKGWAS